VTSHATRDLGLVVLALGGGRHREGHPIDHGVGLDEIAGLGQEVGPGARPLAVVHARDAASAQAAADAVRAAIAVGDQAPVPQPIVTEDIR
jgi:thymidine phosphorylase